MDVDLRRTAAPLLALSILLMPGLGFAQQSASTLPDSLLFFEMPSVVVTATRGAKQIREIPVSTEVLLGDDIEARGSFRLSELLSEQAGLALVHEFGAGVQMQGLNSDYVLILLDGEPVIGRSGGTLDLDRLTVRGLERIEIVRGPSSSLYGSDALAGVINLITRDAGVPFRATAGARFETNATTDLSLSSDFSQGRLNGSVLLNRFSSDGYDHFPDRPGQTVPGFIDYTASARLGFRAANSTRLRASGRFGRLDQKDDIGLSFNSGFAPIAAIGERTEWSASAGIDQKVTDRIRLDGSVYASRFISTTSLEQSEVNPDGAESRFDQRFIESEIKGDALLGTLHLLTAGAGFVSETVEADRVIGGRQSSTAGFGYLQYQWTPTSSMNLVASARYDAHTDYANRLSPKLSVLYRPIRSVHLRASVGSGFKAPTFQQRYLDFNNPIGGYSVFGASGSSRALSELEADGQIRRYTNSNLVSGPLQPEHSWSFNVGTDWYPSDLLELRFNLFFNRITDLIETVLVAEKVNGQQVFSYANLDRIRTQGVEVNVGVIPIAELRLDLGYQYLDAVDLDVMDALAEGTVYKRVDGRDRRVRQDEYGGLFQRSRHSASANIRYRFEPIGLTASVRGTYRSRYGLFDRNGNLILDEDSEYVKGYALCNVTLTQRVTKRASVQFGVKNVFDYTNAELVPSLPGRLIFGGLELRTN